MKIISSHIEKQETRQRILETAGEIFATKGFRVATIREICNRSKANIAAVNYHFGDKERLYVAVLRHTFAVANEKHPLSSELTKDLDPEERLRIFVRTYLIRLLDSSGHLWHGKLIAREISDPTPALSQVVDEMVHPSLGLITEIVKDFLGESVPAETVMLYVRSILGQCLYYFHFRSIIEMLNPDCEFTREKIVQFADHICNFCLPALYALREEELIRARGTGEH